MIGIIGSGLMGKSIALEIAANKKNVMIVSAERAVDEFKLKTEIQELIIKAGYDSKDIYDYLTIVQNNHQLLECEIIIEAMSENLENKRSRLSIYKEFISENCLVCSNTSSLSLVEIFQDLLPLERVMGLHFFNPVNKMPLVELSYLNESQEIHLSKLKDLVESIGKQVILVKNSPGFIVNRLLVPMINEAAKLLDENIGSADDIDKAMKLGANHPIGPLKLADLIGNDIVLSILENLNKAGKDIDISHKLIENVRKNHLGRKTKIGFYKYN